MLSGEVRVVKALDKICRRVRSLAIDNVEAEGFQNNFSPFAENVDLAGVVRPSLLQQLTEDVRGGFAREEQSVVLIDPRDRRFGFAQVCERLGSYQFEVDDVETFVSQYFAETS